MADVPVRKAYDVFNDKPQGDGSWAQETTQATTDPAYVEEPQEGDPNPAQRGQAPTTGLEPLTGTWERDLRNQSALNPKRAPEGSVAGSWPMSVYDLNAGQTVGGEGESVPDENGFGAP